MIIDAFYIKKLVNEINKECFSSKLKTEFDIILTEKRNTTASIEYKKQGKKFSIKSLTINSLIKWDEILIRDTIAHELIHVYEIQVLNIEPSHGVYFINKMNEINKKFDYNIELTKRVSTIKKDNKHYAISECLSKVMFLNDQSLNYLRENEKEVAKKFGKFKIGTISSNNVFFYKSNKNLKEKIIFYELDQKDLEKIGIIRS